MRSRKDYIITKDEVHGYANHWLSSALRLEYEGTKPQIGDHKQTLPVAKVAPPPSSPGEEEEPPPVRVTPEVVEPIPIQQYKECPFCGEQVLANAKKCKHCGAHDLGVPTADSDQRTAAAGDGRSRVRHEVAGTGRHSLVLLGGLRGDTAGRIVPRLVHRRNRGHPQETRELRVRRARA